MRRRTLLAAGVFAVSLVGGGNSEAAPPATQESVMAALAGVKQSRVRFVEQRESRVLETALTVTGTLAFRSPGRIEKHSLRPLDERFVADGDTLLLERQQAGKRFTRTLSLHEVPALAPLVAGLRGVLTGDAALLARHFTVEFSPLWNGWRLRLSPKDAQARAQVESIRFEGEGARVRLIETRESGGDVSRMRLFPL